MRCRILSAGNQPDIMRHSATHSISAARLPEPAGPTSSLASGIVFTGERQVAAAGDQRAPSHQVADRLDRAPPGLTAEGKPALKSDQPCWDRSNLQGLNPTWCDGCLRSQGMSE